MNPLVTGTWMLKTKMRAFNLVVHLIGERGGHKTVPNLKIKKANKTWGILLGQVNGKKLAIVYSTGHVLFGDRVLWKTQSLPSSINHTQNWDPSRLSPSLRVSYTLVSSHFLFRDFSLVSRPALVISASAAAFLGPRESLWPWTTRTSKKSSRGLAKMSSSVTSITVFPLARLP